MSDPLVIGKAIVPLMFAGAFVLTAFGALHLNPERNRVSAIAAGLVAFIGGVFFIINVVMFQALSMLGPISNYVAGLATMYGLFFIMVGLMNIFGVKANIMAPIAILIGWITLAYALFWIWGFPDYGLGSWYYHASIAIVWFITMNMAGFFLAGKLPEKYLGVMCLIAAVYTFAIPGFLWALGPGAQGPF
ncbi:MAG: hypothetical protein RXP30_04390 [Thermoplasmata archaeon]|jgi:hypothetical protein|nr:hypothetical protein [Euryarchaeota archaeon]MVT14815.1 hypothetical protein [Euryarchaeota archaeon]MVT36089.1 hypothetical protein [Euryarchaeota archaeon]